MNISDYDCFCGGCGEMFSFDELVDEQGEEDVDGDMTVACPSCGSTDIGEA